MIDTWQGKALIGLAVLLLGVLSAFASRESSHKAERESWSKQRSEMERSINESSQERLTLTSQLKKSLSMKKRTVPVMLPNGTIAYVTEESSESVEEAVSSLRHEMDTKLAESQRQLTELESKLKEKQEDTTRSAPRWAALAEWEPLGSSPASVSLGAGMNLGSFTLGVLNPLTLEFRPRAHLALRF